MIIQELKEMVESLGYTISNKDQTDSSFYLQYPSVILYGNQKATPVRKIMLYENQIYVDSNLFNVPAYKVKDKEMLKELLANNGKYYNL